MTTYNTGNPIGSVDVKDLYDNAQNLDRLVNDRTVTEYPDRRGLARKSWWGMEQDFNAFLANSQFEYPPLNYVDGTPLTVLRATQIIQRSGQLYRVRLPATFPVNLSGTWATDEPLLTAMSDAALRQDLANTATPTLGAAIIGRASQVVPSIAALRGLSKTAASKNAFVTSYYGDGAGGGGPYRLDASDTTSADNGSTIIVAADGGRWKLVMFGVLNIEQGGAKGDGATDDTAAIQRVLDTGFGSIVATAGRIYRVTDTLTIKTNKQALEFAMAELAMDEASGTKTILKVGGQASQIGGVRLQHITFTRAQACTAGYAVDFDLVGVCEMSGCRVYGNNRIWRGVRVTRGIIVNLLNNYIDNCVNRGIFLVGTGTGSNRTVDVTLSGNRVEGGITALETSDFVEGLFARGNIFFNTSGIGVIVGASSNANGLSSFKLQHNDFDTCVGGGLYVDMVSNIQITGCWFSAVSNFALNLKENSDGAVVTGNQMYPSATGIDVFGNDALIDGNLISGGTTQVLLETTSTYANVSNNQMANGANAINLGGAANALVCGNQMHGFSGSPITGTAGIGTQILNNRGDTVRGTGAYTAVGVSPFTYTAGPRPEAVSFFAGSITQISLGANAISGVTTSREVNLSPGQSVTVTHSGAPTLYRNFL